MSARRRGSRAVRLALRVVAPALRIAAPAARLAAPLMLAAPAVRLVAPLMLAAPAVRLVAPLMLAAPTLLAGSVAWAQPLPFAPPDEGLEMVTPATPTPSPTPTATPTPAATATPAMTATPAVTTTLPAALPPAASPSPSAGESVAIPAAEQAAAEPAAVTEPAVPALVEPPAAEPAAPAAAAAEEEPAIETLRTRSGARFVHRISLIDANGQEIDPDAPDAPPYSPAMTCGKCHAVGAVNQGLHFNAGAPDAGGRRGQPWFWSDPATGTVLPLSERGWAGTFAPAQAGLTAQQMVERFGRHMPGGPPAAAQGGTPPTGRAALAGALENDCMACHSADGLNDQQAREAQVAELNLAWIPTVTEGLGRVRGSVRKLPADYDPITAEVMGSSAEPPTVSYDKARFDANGRVLFNITRAVPAERCAYCHTTAPAHETQHAAARWTHDGDVHLKSGLSCVDCHQHGIDHAMVRGYEGEFGHEPALQAQTLSCAGCHYGTDDAGRPAVRPGARPGARQGGLLALFEARRQGDAPATSQAAPAGRLGSPLPDHAGLPPIHFEKLTCTACHSGPAPGTQTTAVQTSLAHGLGLARRHWPADAAPLLAAPVFLKNERGQLAPYTMTLPAYWGRLVGESVTPLPLEDATRVIAPALAAAAPQAGEEKSGAEKPSPQLSEAQVMAGLAAALKLTDGQGQPVYVANGLLHRLEGGKLASVPHPAAEPLSWPLAHDVRPAGQALGARGCAECHAAGAPFFHGQVAGLDSAAVPGRGRRPMAELMQASPVVLGAWELGFLGRPWLKVIGWGALGLLSLTLASYGASGMRRLGRRLGARGK